MRYPPLYTLTLAALCLCSVPGCNRQLESRVSAAEKSQESNTSARELTERDVESIRQVAAETHGRYLAAESTWKQAERRYVDATRTLHEASEGYRAAAADYEQAAGNYRRVTTVLILAAASDLFLRGICQRPVSTGQYRRMLRSKGVDLDGIDIDHIVSRARGGPDQPWNYLQLDSSVNRSLGAGGLGYKFFNFPLQTVEAMAKFASSQLLCGP